MKILFMSGGARENALRYILEKKQNVIAVITPYLTEKNKRFENVIKIAIEFGIPVFPVTRDNIKEITDSLDFDILVSCGFPYILDKEIFSKPKYAINVHPTLLPKYRGYRSGPYIVINGEKQSGVTVHFITEKMDDGDIILQKAFDLTPFDTTKSLVTKSSTLEPEILNEAIELLKSNNLRTIPQNENEATVYSHCRTPKDSLIDWNKSLKELYNEIRACDWKDYPAHFFVDGEKVCIKLWRENKSVYEEDMI